MKEPAGWLDLIAAAVDGDLEAHRINAVSPGQLERRHANEDAADAAVINTGHRAEVKVPEIAALAKQVAYLATGADEDALGIDAPVARLVGVFLPTGQVPAVEERKET